MTYDEPPDVRVSAEAHREEVVRRLLERGLSRQAILALMPAWQPLVDRLTGADEASGAGSVWQASPPT